MRRAVIAVFTAVVIVILFLVLCTFVRRPYERVLLVRFGRLIEDKDQARLAYNWYFKMPTDSVVRIDTRLHLYNGPLQEVPTKEKQTISVRAFAAWKIVDPVKFYNTTTGSDQEAQSRIAQRMSGLVRSVSLYSMDELFNTDEKLVKTPQLERQIAIDATNGADAPDIREAQKGLKEEGIEIVQVGFSRMAYPPSNAEAVYLAMVAKLTNQARVWDAEGQAKRIELEAEGNRRAEEIRAEARKEAEEIRGQAEAQARRLLADAQQTPGAREFYQYWKSLDFRKAMMTRNTVLVLSADDPSLSGLFPQQMQTLPEGMPGPATQPAGPATRPAGALTPPPEAAPAGQR
jgi:membrane protease subunit HflC